MRTSKWTLFCTSVWLTLSFSTGEFVSKQEPFANFLSRSWKKCSMHPSLILCVKQRSVLALDRLIKGKDDIEFPGDIFSLVKNKRNPDNSAELLTEEILDKYLPKNLTLQEKTVDLLLEAAYRKFLSGRSIQIRLPWNTRQFGVMEEGRGDKKNKGGGFAMGAALAAMTMLPMALAGIGMLAGKSLMVSMLALMMSALMGMRKGGDSGHSSYEVISIPAGGGGHHHGRELEDTGYSLHGIKR